MPGPEEMDLALSPQFQKILEEAMKDPTAIKKTAEALESLAEYLDGGTAAHSESRK